MKQGKFEVKCVKKHSGKPVVLLVALALILGIAAGGTIAWLMDSTNPVVNTFTTSDIGITLTETTTAYQMIPGHTITKDPMVTVVEGSESCYVFVKLEKTANFDTFMTYEVAEGWMAGTGENGNGVPVGVYYRTVSKSEAAQEFAVLKDDKVTVKATVTKAQMKALTETTYPKLTITAFACQLHEANNTEFTAAEAWVICNPATES